VTIQVEIARELRYELGMVDFTHAQLSEAAWNDEKALSTGMLAALVESFIAHARLMDEFLGGRENVRKDDVVAAHHVSLWGRRGFLTPEDRNRADKQLLHFTTRRRQRERWPIHAIARGLACTYLEFYDLLETDDQYELEGTAIAARAIIKRCDIDPRREINLGLVWAEAEEEDLNE
jgi:hypothetical protein